MLALLGGGLGAIAGSFLATLVVRWPAGRTLGGRSACDGCGQVLRWWELVPLVSALAQRGRCRRCGTGIAHDHLVIEAAAAVIGALAFGLADGLVAAVLWALFGWMLLTLAALDARHLWLPDRLTLPLGAIGLVVGGVATEATLTERAIGAAAGFGVLWAIGAGYRLVRRREGLGGGDPKLFGAIGAWLGWPALPFVLLSASIVGLIAAALAGDLRRDRAVAFGAALAAGAVPGWLALQYLGGSVRL